MMNWRRSLLAVLSLVTLQIACGVAAAQSTVGQSLAAHAIVVRGDHFERDGMPYQILSGAIHYARVPREYWRDRLAKAKAMGLNTVETYVFWNLHEPRPGEFDFSGQLDVAAFVRMAQEEGLNVIVRPGPYVCAEWEAGGFPAWLFKDPTLKVRTRDARFLEAADRYLQRVGKELASLQVSHGGPIVAVQIENEYGSFGSDREYEEAIHQSLLRAGLGDSLFYTSDGADQMHNSILPGILAVANYGPGEAKVELAKLIAIRPNAPVMNGEYWDGWFDAWGDKSHVHTNAEEQVADLDWMLSKGYSFNLYMFEGGTSFGFMNGANYQPGADEHYSPQTTSYDYDAALDEAGRPTKKFFLMRDAIARHTRVKPADLPQEKGLIQLPEIKLNQAASLWSNLPEPVNSEHPLTLEALGQSYGYVLYHTQLKAAKAAKLKIADLRYYAAVYLNKKLVGTLDRRLKQDELVFDVESDGAELDLLIENTGRVNYGPKLTDGRAGIVGDVLFNGVPIVGWANYSLPMSGPESLHGWAQTHTQGPGFYRGEFTVEHPGDTYLDVSNFRKGFVRVNGHNLGRVWDVGPQRTLYLPGVWLHAGKNEVTVFDALDVASPSLRGVSEPIWLGAKK